jgi:hypothetical protein
MSECRPKQPYRSCGVSSADKYTCLIKLYSILTVHFSNIDNVIHQPNALVIKILKYSKTVWGPFIKQF